ncbi:MAG: hypothetical protein SPI77_04295 [Corynebacterium sp.]|nr:hypothetical protein [Corynebacterium sp.]
MKKFVAGLTIAVVALSLGACSPARQKDSTEAAMSEAQAAASSVLSTLTTGAPGMPDASSTGAMATTTTTAAATDAAGTTLGTLTDESGAEYTVPQAIATKYDQLAATGEGVGILTNAADMGDGVWVARFQQNGYTHYIVYSPQTQAVAVHGEIGNYWQNLGGVNSPAGLPLAEEIEGADSFTQQFENGVITWDPATNVADFAAS